MATLDLTLDSFEVPALSEYIPPFGHKKQEGGLSTREVNNNIMMPFLNMRPTIVTENSVTTRIEYDAKLVFFANLQNAVNLDLEKASYIGCEILIYNLSAHACTVNKNTWNYTVPAGGYIKLMWNGSAWSKGNSLGLPVGAVQGFALGTQSPNWLLCDGRDTTGTADELATQYPALYTYLGNSNVLPDYRECTLVGVGQNDTDTIADHDVYTLGQFKDDQLQNITGTYTSVMKGDNPSPSASGAIKNINCGTIRWQNGQNGTGGGGFTFDASRVARTGTTTHGKQKGVAFYIKATD